MAKRITAAQLKSVCTDAEIALLMASRPGAIEALPLTNLRRNVASARRLRDKWRDLESRQLRATKKQRDSEMTRAQSRSAEKGELFAEALQRFASRLKMAGPKAGAARIGRQAGSGVDRNAKQAGAAHAARTSSRGRLNRARGDFNTAEGEGRPPKVAEKSPPARKASKPARLRGRFDTDRDEQHSTATAMRRSRLHSAEFPSRSPGHIQTRNKRAQAKRDSRA